MCYDIIDQIYDNYYAYLACRRHEEHALLISSPPPSTNDPAPSLDVLTTQAAHHADRLTAWLRTRPNIFRPEAQGGASYLFVPVLHHALRRAGVPLPFFVIPDRQRDQFARNRVAQVPLHPQWGGLVVEAAWEALH